MHPNITIYDHLTKDSIGGDIPIKFRSSAYCKAIYPTVIIGGSSGLDSTYKVGDSDMWGGPSMFCGAAGITAIGQTVNGLTAHPGVYGTIFIDNTITMGVGSTGNGIRTRSTRSKINGNYITSTSAGNGVLIGEAFTRESIVANNFVRGFDSGIRQSQINFEVDGFNNSASVMIAGNDISGANTGILIDVDGTSNTRINTVVRDNKIHWPNIISGSNGIAISSYANGISIFNNDISNADNTGIVFDENTSNLSIYDNTFKFMGGADCVRGGGVGPQITDLVTFVGGAADSKLYLGRIISDGTEDDTVINTPRDHASYNAIVSPGYQTTVIPTGDVSPTVGRSTLAFFVDVSGSPSVLKIRAHDPQTDTFKTFDIGTFT